MRSNTVPCRARPARRALATLLPGVVALLCGCDGGRQPAPPGTAGGGQPAASATAAPLVTMTVAVEPAVVAPGGAVTLMWTLRPAAGWHLYGNVRNDSGFAPRQRLGLPAGWEAGPLQWPAPARYLSAGDILDHVYEGELVLLQEVRVPAGAAPGAGEMRAHWEWLACRDSCVPGRDSLSVALSVAPPAAAAASAGPLPPALVAARARLPQPLPGGLVEIGRVGDVVRIEPVGGAGERRFSFVPALDCGELADLVREGEGPRLALRMLPADGRLGPLRGLLVVQSAAGTTSAYTIDVPAVAWPAGDA